MGYPVLSHLLSRHPSNLGGHNIGGINGSGQVPEITGHFGLLDPDTPKSAYYYNTHKDNSKWQLVFSDEFNVDGRSFYPVCLSQKSACSIDPIHIFPGRRPLLGGCRSSLLVSFVCKTERSQYQSLAHSMQGDWRLGVV